MGIYVGANLAHRPAFQARVKINIMPQSAAFKNPEQTCPHEAFVDGFASGESADYTLTALWSGDVGWVTVLERRDEVLIYDHETAQFSNRDATKVLRQACRVVESDFPALLATERERVPTENPGSTELASSSASNSSDGVRRYQLAEYREGTIAGLALLDSKLGRVWAVTEVLDKGGRKVRDEFQEVGVQDLWDTDDELYDRVQEASSESEKDLWIHARTDLDRVKQLTRPNAIQKAEQTAYDERHPTTRP